MNDVLAHVQARFEANGLTFTASRDDAGVFYGQCPRDRGKLIRLDLDVADDLMYVHAGPCRCLPFETIRQLGLGDRAVANVPAGIRTELAKRRLGVRSAALNGGASSTGGDGYARLVSALETGGLGGTRSDPDAVRGEGRYRCPACGALGDGHGLKVTRNDDGGAVFHCFNCGAAAEVLAALGLTWADLGYRPDRPHSVRTATIAETEAVFTRWLGKEYDLGALDVVLAAAAVEQLGGDPPWVLIVSGSGNAKTETVAALAGGGAHVVSTISSEGALLSATPGKERSKDATGGLLRKVGPRGLVVIKDFTSILAMNRDLRASVLAALREIYDGRWDRNVGTDGGKTLTWVGRIVVVGAVTSAYDAAHSVIAAMGDRFCLVRVSSSTAAARLAGRPCPTSTTRRRCGPSSPRWSGHC